MAQRSKQDSRLRKVVARRIRALRTKSGLSQEDLAEMTGFHRTYIGSVERAERNVTLSTLEAFAHALNIPVSELVKEVSGDGK